MDTENSEQMYIPATETPLLSKSYYRYIECTTATLLATLMWRRPLNSATLATATHKELRGVSDGTRAQVRV